MLALSASLAGAQPPSLEPLPLVPPFSVQAPGPLQPRGWEIIRLSSRKPITSYDFVPDGLGVVLRARADASVGVLAHATTFDVHSAPLVRWRWKIEHLIPHADNRVGTRDDSPARIL